MAVIRKRALLTLALLTAVLATACGSQHTSSSKTRSVSLVLDFTPNAIHSGIYTAIARGYDRAAGINLHVIIPGAVPHILIGLRLAMQTCWTVIVAAELLGAIYGIGKVLSTAKDDVYPGMILVGMTTVAVLGISTTYVLELAERRFVTWRR